MDFKYVYVFYCRTHMLRATVVNIPIVLHRGKYKQPKVSRNYVNKTKLQVFFLTISSR